MNEIISESSFWDKNIVKIIAIGIAVLTFIIERFITYFREKRTAKYNWFIKIIVEPYLDEITKFYKTTHEELKRDLQDLKANQDLSDIDYVVLSRGYCNSFKDRRKDFFNPFVSMVNAFDTNISTNVDNIINQLDDCYVTAIDFANVDADSKGLVNEIANNKALLYQTLFEGISYNRKDIASILIIILLLIIIVILLVFVV